MKNIDISYVATENFYEMCKYSISTVIENKKDDVSITFHIFTSSYTNYFDGLKSDTIKFDIIPIDENWLKQFKAKYNNSGGIKNHNFDYGFVKFLIMKLDIDVVLYLDCDVYVFEDLSPLFVKNSQKCLKVVGSFYNYKQFCNGVMVFNNYIIKNTNKYNECVDFAKNNFNNSHDQMIFNTIFENDVEFVDCGYQCEIELLLKNYRQVENYFNHRYVDLDDIDSRGLNFTKLIPFIDKLKILHFYGEIKEHFKEIYNVYKFLLNHKRNYEI